MTMKRSYRILALILALMLSLACFAACGERDNGDETTGSDAGEQNPGNTVGDYVASLLGKDSVIGKLMSDVSATEGVGTVLKAFGGGSVEFGAKLDADKFEEIGADLSVGGKLYAAGNAFMLDQLKLKWGDKSISASAYIGSDGFYVKCAQLLSEVYGAEFKKIQDELASSVFAPGSGSSFEIDESLFELIKQSVGSLGSLGEVADIPITDETKKLADDTVAIISNYITAVNSVLEKNGIVSVTVGDFETNNETVNARTYAVTLDDAKLTAALNEIYAYIKNDESVKTYIGAHFDFIMSMVSEKSAGIVGGANIPNITAQDVIEQYDGMIAAFGEQIKSVDGALDGTVIKIEIVSVVSDKTLCAIRMTEHTEDDDDAVLLLDIGKNGIVGSDKITLWFDGSVQYQLTKSKDGNIVTYKLSQVHPFYGDMTDSLVLTYDTSSNKWNLAMTVYHSEVVSSGGGIYGELIGGEDGDEEIGGSHIWGTIDGDINFGQNIEFNIVEFEQHINMSGKFVCADGVLSVSLDKVSSEQPARDEETGEYDLTETYTSVYDGFEIFFTVNANDTMPERENFKPLLTITEKDIADIMQKFNDLLKDWGLAD